MKNKSNSERVITFLDNEPDSCKEFQNYYQLSKQPFIVYADTETVTKVDGEFAQHKVIAYMLHVKCSYDASLSKSIIYCDDGTGKDSNYEFMRDITQIRLYISEHVNKKKYLKNSEKEYFLENNKPEQCLFCSNDFQVSDNYYDEYFASERINRSIWEKKKQDKTKQNKTDIEELKSQTVDYCVHHDHNTGEIIGYLCQRCNKNESKSQSTFSVVFHNLQYDLLALVKSFGEKTFTNLDYYGNKIDLDLQNKLSIIGQSSMKYSNLKIMKEYISTDAYNVYLPTVNFIDSFRFITKGLSSIVETTVADSESIVDTDIASIVKRIGEEKDIVEKECDTEYGIKLNAVEVLLYKYYSKNSDSLKIKIDNLIAELKHITLKQMFKNTHKYITDKYDDTMFTHSTKKGLIAYDHVNLENLQHPGNLPIDCYSNSLTLVTTKKYIDSIVDEEMKEKLIAFRKEQKKDTKEAYAETNVIYNDLKKVIGKDMCYKDYFIYYLELDIMLLTDIFENLRDQLISTHKIDPAYHQGLASYSQNCFLHHTKAKLHLIEPVDVSKIIIDNCRGGYSGIMKRSSENFENDIQKIIKGWDVNNLYGAAMIQKLANKYLGEISLKEFKKEKKEWAPDGDFAYFLLTDYTVPVEIHDTLSKFPPLISRKSVEAKDVSVYTQSIKETRTTCASTKLCSTLEDGTDYLMDYENYLFYIRMGYEITIKRVFKFEQEYILKKYIDMNSALRQKSSTEINKQLYKDLNNICYGKSLQNPMKYSNVELINSERVVQDRIHNPLLKAFSIVVQDKLVLTDMYNSSMSFDTCIQYGFHILEKSKLHMYSSIWEKMVPFYIKYDIDFNFMLSDTDSVYTELLLHNSEFNNEAEMMIKFKKEYPELFDLHLYINPLIKDTTKKKVVGYFLDDYSDQKTIEAIVGLAAKSYTYIVRDNRKTIMGKDKDNFNLECEILNEDYNVAQLKIKGKGVSTKYLESLFEYKDFKQISDTNKLDSKIKFRGIVKKEFGNIITETTKIALSSYDDKNYIYRDNKGNIKYLPYGHYKIAKLRKRGKIG